MGERWTLSARSSDENQGFSNLEPGRYLLGIESKEDSLTEKKQYPMATLKCVALEGPSKGALFHRVTCTPQGEPGHGFLLHFLHAVGLPYGGDNPDENVEIEFDSDEFIGRQFWADVEIEEYEKKGDQPGQPTGKAARAKNIYTAEQIAEEQGQAPAAKDKTDEGSAQEPQESAEEAAEREAKEAAEAEAAAAAAAAAAKPKSGLKKPLVKPPLKSAVATNGKAAVAPKHSFARR